MYWQGSLQDNIDGFIVIPLYFKIGNLTIALGCGNLAVNRKIPEAVIGTQSELLIAVERGLFCDKDKFTELCLTYTSPETPLPIKLLALGWLDYELSISNTECSPISTDILKRDQQLRREIIQEVSIQQPLYVAFAVLNISMEASEDARLSLTDIENLEEAASRPRWAPIPKELYEDYLKRFIALGSSNPQTRARSQSHFLSEIFIVATV